MKRRMVIWVFSTLGLALSAHDTLVLAARHKGLYPKPMTIKPRKAKKIKWQMREDVQA